MYISTIDGILNMFLKRYGHKFNLSPDFQLSYGQAGESLFDSMAEQCVFEKNFSLLKKIPYSFLKKLFLFYFKCRLKYGRVSFYDESDFKDFNRDRELFLSMGASLKKTERKSLDAVEIQKLFEKQKSPLVGLFNGHISVSDIREIFEEEDIFNSIEFVSPV